MTTDHRTAVLELLTAQFPGQAFIPLTKAGAAIGYKAQTCYNLVHKGQFPLVFRKIGRKSMVSLMDLADFMSGVKKEEAAPVVEPEQPRRVGRPTKAEQRARAMASA